MPQVTDPNVLSRLNQGAPQAQPSPIVMGPQSQPQPDLWNIPVPRQKQAQTEHTEATTGKVRTDTGIAVNKEAREDREEGRKVSELQTRLNSLGTKIDQDALNIDKIIQDPHLDLVTGYVEGRLPTIVNVLLKGKKGQQVQDLQSRIDYLKATATLGALTELRAQSPTGGALGNVSDRDMQILKDASGRLQQAQSPEAFKSALKELQDQYRITKRNIIEAHQRDIEAGLVKLLPSQQPRASSSPTNWIWRNGKLERQ